MKSHESGYAKIRWAFQDVGGFSGIAEEDGTAIALLAAILMHYHVRFMPMALYAHGRGVTRR